MATPIILAFNISPEKLGRMRMLCARVKTRLRTVSEGEYALTLGQLVAGEAAADKAIDSNNVNVEDESFTDEMLVISGLSGAQFNLFLQDFKRFGISPIQLKAMLTATNAEWTPVQLHKELCVEREAFARGMSAHEGK